MNGTPNRRRLGWIAVAALVLWLALGGAMLVLRLATGGGAIEGCADARNATLNLLYGASQVAGMALICAIPIYIYSPSPFYQRNARWIHLTALGLVVLSAFFAVATNPCTARIFNG